MKNARFPVMFIVTFIVCSMLVAFKNADDQPKKVKAGYFKLAEGLTDNDYMPRTVIFKLKEANRNFAGVNSISNNKIEAALNSIGATAPAKVFADAFKPAVESVNGEKTSDLSLIYVVKYNSGRSIEEAVNEIYATGEVEYAQPKYIQKVSFTPNDPSLGQQYYINRIQATAGWDVQQGDTNVVIGIVDSGIDWDHPDLAANIKINYADPINGADDDGDGYVDNFRGWDFGGADYTNVVADNNPMIMGSNNSHGSHVAGDASAVTNNGVGVSGPGFKCKLMGIKCAADNDTRGPGGQGYIISGYEGIRYAADRGCAVINCSWGGGGGGQFEQDVITYATVNKNALVVCAAGNESSSASFYPASYKYVLSVASTNSSDVRSSFSNFGNNIDVCAPGSSIYSTLWNNSYAVFDGTSMASPIAAGVCAIVKSQFPTYTAIQVGEKVRVNCDNIDAQNPSYIGALGKGRVNMFKALTVNSPSVRLLSNVITDGNNNVPQPNDTLNIVGTFRNYLQATANASVAITATSNAITLLNGNSTLGAIPTLGSVTNSSTPFRIRVNSNAPANTIVNFKVSYTDGSYSDFEYFSVVINPSYFNMDVNKIATTINSRGIGFKYNNLANILFEGGLICATSSSRVSDVVRGVDQSIQNNDFTNIIPFQITQPGVLSNQDGSAKYNDNGAGATKIGVEISFNSFAFSNETDEDYIIMRYKIRNTNATEITGFYAGLFGDWDLGDQGNLNKVDFDPANRLGYIWRTDNNPSTYAGMSLLSATNVSYWAIDNDNTIAGNPWGIYDGFTDQEKYQSLSSGIGRTQAGGTSGRDVANVIGSGPYSIPANGEITIAFALIGGNNLSDLQANAVAARNKYTSLVGITNYNSELPSDFSLSQNYPNPFNPTTNIKFSIANPGLTSLKIYNTLGKEVASLVNEYLQAGSYDADWNASGNSSGVYFYRLQADGFVQTKRMLLIK
jgi:subtilisin family serine protease